jgi:hypothetical protein
MRTSLLALSAAAILISSVQAQETTAPRPVAPVVRPDPNGPSQIGRTQLANYLNTIAATQTAKRREAIARIQTRAEAEAHQREVRAKILHLLGDLPDPPGNEETKSSILGPFYLTELRAELVGKTLLGLRVDDVISAVSFTSGGTTVDPNQITAQASGHLGLVLLHAAVLDPRLKHITIDHTLPSYKSLLEVPMPIDAPEDILPGVLRRYDLPDLIRELGPRLTLAIPSRVLTNLEELPSSP